MAYNWAVVGCCFTAAYQLQVLFFVNESCRARERRACGHNGDQNGAKCSLNDATCVDRIVLCW